MLQPPTSLVAQAAQLVVAPQPSLPQQLVATLQPPEVDLLTQALVRTHQLQVEVVPLSLTTANVAGMSYSHSESNDADM